MEQRKNFYLFFKEVINNAAKHSCAKSVVTRISLRSHHVEMLIIDDGVGFNTSDIYDGNGMSSFRKRAADLRGNFNMTSSNDSGTTVKLSFKSA